MTDNIDVFAAMQTGEPYRTYKKSILGKVYLTVLNPFNTKESQGIILSGNPRTNDKGCFLKIWTLQEDVFLRKMNEYHFEQGNIVEWHSKPEPERKLYSAYTEDEVAEIVNSHHLKLQNTLNSIESEAFLLRLLDKADELEKSDKIVAKIQARLAEVQYAEPAE